jgi:hypothetical protein
VQCAWAKLKKLPQILTARSAYFQLKEQCSAHKKAEVNKKTLARLGTLDNYLTLASPDVERMMTLDNS